MHAFFNEARLGRSAKYIAFFSLVVLTFAVKTSKRQNVKTPDIFCAPGRSARIHPMETLRKTQSRWSIS
jgi:hypothetical protein